MRPMLGLHEVVEFGIGKVVLVYLLGLHALISPHMLHIMPWQSSVRACTRHFQRNNNYFD